MKKVAFICAMTKEKRVGLFPTLFPYLDKFVAHRCPREAFAFRREILGKMG